MADYEFYVNCYLGSAIPEKAFPTAAAQAAAALARIERVYTVSGGEETRALAICAMAEAVYAASKRKAGISAASVGNLSVHYENSDSADKALRKELYQRAAIYLDIYRGTSL